MPPGAGRPRNPAPSGSVSGCSACCWRTRSRRCRVPAGVQTTRPCDSRSCPARRRVGSRRAGQVADRRGVPGAPAARPERGRADQLCAEHADPRCPTSSAALMNIRRQLWPPTRRSCSRWTPASPRRFPWNRRPIARRGTPEAGETGTAVPARRRFHPTERRGAGAGCALLDSVQVVPTPSRENGCRRRLPSAASAALSVEHWLTTRVARATRAVA